MSGVETPSEPGSPGPEGGSGEGQGQGSGVRKRREVYLRVSELKVKDNSRIKVKIDISVMKELGINPGDVVEIEGRKKTAAIAWPSYGEDEPDVIRMDAIVRKNAGISIGDKVIVRKASPKNAQMIRIGPAQSNVTFTSIEPSFVSYVKKRLEDTPLVEGDIVYVPLLGQPMPFIVVQTRPSGVVIITKDTQLYILDKPVSNIKVSRVTYDDIGGLGHIIEKVRELVELPLRHPEIFRRLGIEPPKGILLYGPPGVGKTLLAKAVATESGANFISVRGPEILSKWVGESERAIREIFRKARVYAPTVILFDEIDSIVPHRGSVNEGTHVTERIVSQLLTEIDGIEKLNNVVIIGATNRPDLIDPALLRPGRLDKVIYVPPPEMKSRLEILKVHTRKMPLAEDVDLEYIARATEGYVGADLTALVREAALYALREDLSSSRVYMRHFLQAMTKIRPSLSEDMIRFYESWRDRFKQRLPKQVMAPPIYA